MLEGTEKPLGAELPLSAGRRCSKTSCLALQVLESAAGITEST